MATPTWNQLAAPNFSAGNDLIAQAMNQLTKATTGFKSIADQYKDTIQKRNLGLIQEYVNSAKTPEELQSEAFKTGLANLTGGMKGEYDPVAVNQYTDTRGDTLTRRAVDSLNLESGQFDLGQKRLRAPTELDLLQTNALNAKQKLNFDAQNNPLVLAANEVAANVARKTESTQVAQALANLNNTNSTISAREKELKLREQELGIQRLKALANDGGFTLQNGEAAISDGISNIRKIQQDALNGVSDKFSYKDMDAVDKAILKDETWASLGLPDTAKKVKELITKNPELSKLPNPVKASVYMNAVAKIREGNLFGKDDWLFQNDDKYLNAVIDSAKENTGYLSNAQRMETAAIQDLASKLSRMSQGNIDYLKAYAYVQSQLGASPLASMAIDEKALDNIKKAGSKEGGDNVKKAGSPVLPQSGFGLELGGNIVVNQNPVAAQTQPKAINKAATAEAKEVKQSVFTDTPLKVLANAVKPVPSPLIPVESQNAFRVKENNLALDFRTGKSTPTKDPVPMPKVDWKEPVQAVTLNPIYAQLPQYKAVVTFAPDGDTLRAKSKDYKTTGQPDIYCRIDSVEAPETPKPQYGKKGQPYGEEAAQILKQMVLNKEVSIRVTAPTEMKNGKMSNYGRDVCQIEVAGKDVSLELLRAGAAWLYKEFNRYGQGGFDLESTARESKLGLWGLPNPTYPPNFRHNGYQNP